MYTPGFKYLSSKTGIVQNPDFSLCISMFAACSLQSFQPSVLTYPIPLSSAAKSHKKWPARKKANAFCCEPSSPSLEEIKLCVMIFLKVLGFLLLFFCNEKWIDFFSFSFLSFFLV